MTCDCDVPLVAPLLPPLLAAAVPGGLRREGRPDTVLVWGLAPPKLGGTSGNSLKVGGDSCQLGLVRCYLYIHCIGITHSGFIATYCRQCR